MVAGKEKKKRNKYLYQLIVSSSILVIVPTIFFFVLFFENSYKEIEKSNREYYERISRVFCGSIVDIISEFNNHVVTFSVNSKDRTKSSDVFYEGTLKMKENEYYYWEAARDLSEYSKKIGPDVLGIYYYDIDVILYDGKKYSANRFLQDCLGVKLEGSSGEKIGDFFAEESYRRSETIFEPIFSENGTYDCMLVGTCIRLGKNNEKALCFQILYPEDMEFFYQSIQGKPWEGYYVFERQSGRFLFGLGNLRDEIVKDGVLSEKAETYLRNEDASQPIFFSQSKQFEITVLVDATDNTEQNNIIQFYNEMRIFIVYIMLIMVIVCCVAVYWNYRPIYRLMTKIHGEGESEFEVILNSFESQGLKLTEQRMLIMDLLMNHLIYGLPIAENYVGKLGISNTLRYYCVSLIDDYVLDTAETELLTKEAEKRFQTLLFVTDMQGEKTTVVIAFMPADHSSSIAEWLKEWCITCAKKQCSAATGCMVKDINEIKKSLDMCRKYLTASETYAEDEKKKKAEQVAKNKTESYEILKREIIIYLEENYWNRDLSQILVADHFHISVYSLSRMFKKQFNMGFSEYVNIKRLERAKELLEKTDRPIKDISMEVGFSEANYFSRLFKHNYGISPTEFRSTIK